MTRLFILLLHDVSMIERMMITLHRLPAAPLVLALLLVHPHVAAVDLVADSRAVLGQHQPRQEQHQHDVTQSYSIQILIVSECEQIKLKIIMHVLSFSS